MSIQRPRETSLQKGHPEEERGMYPQAPAGGQPRRTSKHHFIFPQPEGSAVRPILHLRVNASVGSQVWRAGESRGQARRRRPGPAVEGEEARQRRDQDLGDVGPEFSREELHDFPGLLCSLGWSTSGQRLRHLLGSCGCVCRCCCCCAGLIVEEGGPWSQGISRIQTKSPGW